MLRLVTLSSVNTDDVLSQREEKTTDSVVVVKDFVNINKDDQSYNIYEKVSLFVSNNNHYDKHKKKEIIDRITTQLYAINQKTGSVYGFIPEEQEDFFFRIFRSTRVAVSLENVTSTLSTFPYTGCPTAGSKISVQLGFTQMAKTIFSHFIDSLSSKLLSFSTDISANNTYDLKARAEIIAAELSVGSFGGGFENKLAVLLEENFILWVNKYLSVTNNLQNDSHNKIINQWAYTVIYDAMNLILKE